MDDVLGRRVAAPTERQFGRADGGPHWAMRLLRVPLLAKLLGANAVLLIAATGTAMFVHDRALGTTPVILVVGTAFLAALALNIVLVALAVRPLHALEATVDAVWQGDLDARVPASHLADRDVERVGRLFNVLLDGLLADRARTRRLASELIHAGDAERAAISRELHDFTAQSLAALVMQLSVASRGAQSAPRDALQQRIETARLLATTVLEEVRLLAHTMHPRLLDELGLVAALRRLARETSEHAAARAGPSVLVDVCATEGSDAGLPSEIASVLYRVAQEAVQNAQRHAHATRIEIRLCRVDGVARLEVADDGVGFEPAATPSGGTGIGLFTMQERVALVDGTLQVTSTRGAGTTVHASVPLHPEPMGSAVMAGR